MKDEYEEVLEEDAIDKNMLEQRDGYEEEEVEPPIPPEGWGPTLFKYQTEADIPKTQRHQLSPVRQLYGRHVSLGNTQRRDNLRHLDVYDLSNNYMRITLLRHLAVQRMGRKTAELQLCRSNEEIGGFERRMQVTGISRQSATMKEEMTPEKKKKFLDRFKKPEQKEQTQEVMY